MAGLTLYTYRGFNRGFKCEFSQNINPNNRFTSKETRKIMSPGSGYGYGAGGAKNPLNTNTGLSILAILLSIMVIASQMNPNWNFLDRIPPKVGIISPSYDSYVTDIVQVRGLIYEPTNYSVKIFLNSTKLGPIYP